MNKWISILLGLGLIGMGVLALTSSLVMPMLGIELFRWSAVRLWPSVVLGIGWAFVLPPLFVHRRPGLGGLFIPGVPILVTGSILMLASVLNWWHVWAWLWPLEVLSVAAGFLLAAAYMRVIWLVIPAFIVGANGLLFQFCALTDLWGVWAFMWTIEPLSLGLAFLFIGARKRLNGLMLAGLILCTLAGGGLIGMIGILSVSAVFAGWWVLRLVGPSILVLAGVLLILWSLGHYSLAPHPKPR